MCGHARDVVIYFGFHQNPFRGFGATGGLNFPIPITLAIGFYSSLYCHTSRDKTFICGHCQPDGWIWGTGEMGDGKMCLRKGLGKTVCLKVPLTRGKWQTIANFERELIPYWWWGLREAVQDAVKRTRDRRESVAELLLEPHTPWVEMGSHCCTAISK